MSLGNWFKKKHIQLGDTDLNYWQARMHALIIKYYYSNLHGSLHLKLITH